MCGCLSISSSPTSCCTASLRIFRASTSFAATRSPLLESRAATTCSGGECRSSEAWVAVALRRRKKLRKRSCGEGELTAAVS